MDSAKTLVAQALSELRQLQESTLDSKKQPECAFCHKNPPRSWESSLCETCFQCAGCGTKDIPGLFKFKDRLLCGPCNEAAREEAQKERDQRDTQKRIDAAGFYPAHVKATFEVLDARQKKIATGYLAIPEGNLIINGLSGSGKTWTAVATAKRLVERGATARYISAPWMFALLRDCIGHDKDFQITEYVRSLLDYDYIILDDLGAHRATDWAIETLYLILDQWEANDKKGLICTTNLSMDDIAKMFSDRIASRLAASCKLIKLDGDDKRIK